MASDTQEQPADSDTTVRFASAVLGEREEPPRPVSARRAITCTYRGRGIAGPLLFFSALSAALFVMTFWQEGTTLEFIVWRGFLVVFTLFCALLVPWSGLRLAHWCRNGVVAHAEVTGVRMVSDKVDGKPLAQGERIVHHPRLGDYRDKFAIGGSWVGGISEGSTLDVLVAPDRPKSWLTLGIHAS